jgi:D-threo-aldose 1-dehydrogenase
MKLQDQSVGVLPKLSFGCASIGNLYVEISDAEAETVLSAAWNAGIRYFDTAPHYGRGLSEERLGAFLRGRSDFVISTKVGRVMTPASELIAEADGFINPAQNDVYFDYSGDGLERSFEQSLERLGLTHIDILYVHDLGEYAHGAAGEDHMRDFLSTGYDRLVKLRESGRIGAFGLGVNECQVCIDVLNHGPLDYILLAGRYTLLEQGATETLFPLCEKQGVKLVIGGVFNSGILATGAKPGAHYNYGPAPEHILDRVRQLEAICTRHGVPLATAALQFPARHPLVASTLIGTGKISSLLRNVEQYGAEIPDALWAELAAEGQIGEAS